ncbi:hypothetical protein N0V90_002051 [Kalmusia sp. IMI 367209]|nr:hypothetical protein N0V90_002051 [Kalmusia sp. IMI 367209]
MQTIHFSIAVAALCKDLYEGRSPDEDVENRRIGLQGAVRNLRPASLITSNDDQIEEQQLQTLAKKLIDAADDLEKELAKFKTNSQGSRRHAAKNSIKYALRTKRKIDKMDQLLRGCQKEMETRILVRLSNRTDILERTIKDASKKTDKVLQDFLQHLKCKQTQLHQIIDSNSGQILASIQADGDKTRALIDDRHGKTRRAIVHSMHTNKDHFDQSIAQYRSTEVDDRNLEGFIKSFKYPDMYQRQNADAINRTHEGTFQWIFEEEIQEDSDDKYEYQYDASDVQSWSSFSDWSTSEDNSYWISGKPGSGKSCLMRFLVTSPRTKENLARWRPQVQILSAYVWLAGSLIQRSQKGVLATLLHQLLLNNEQTAKSLYIDYAQLSKDTISDWSFAELQNCMFRALRLVNQSICIFVDGLDEIDPKEFGGKLAFTQLLKDIACLPNMKVCVGSREEVVFKDAYKDYPQLRLQDLTFKDIRKHARDSLQVMLDNDNVDTTSNLAQEKFNDLVQQISWKAEGVFLWVSVVVSNIRRAYLEDNEDMDGLFKRIEQLPTDISQLYTEIWSRLNSDDKQIYKTESALCFQIALLEPDLDLLKMTACRVRKD